ncbi:MAG: hypothetical protein J1E39_00420 [Eubacterium sp.]|nr:hypothetical protein [Eubacterium sp.]
MTIDDLCIVNYCHPGCTPLLNIMRLPKDEAFALAYKMSEQNKNTTAFYRFADFENYYPKRLQTDKLLCLRFIELGGKPIQQHPLSFVLHKSDYLNSWFDSGIVTKIPLKHISSDCISFTYGDSMSTLDRRGEFTMLTKDMLLKTISDYDGTVEEFMAYIEKQYHYIEAQVWDDKCIKN